MTQAYDPLDYDNLARSVVDSATMILGADAATVLVHGGTSCILGEPGRSDLVRPRTEIRSWLKREIGRGRSLGESFIHGHRSSTAVS